MGFAVPYPSHTRPLQSARQRLLPAPCRPAASRGRWRRCRHGVRGVARDHHLGLGIDVDALAVDAARHVGAVGVVGDPPLIAVGGARQGGVAGRLEFFGIAAARDVLDHLRGHDLAAVEAAVMCAWSRRSGRDLASVVERPPPPLSVPMRSDVIMRVFLRPHGLPDAFGEKIGQRQCRWRACRSRRARRC